jgi:hypothetical protein
VASGTAAELAERFPSAEHVDFGDGVVVPGFNDAIIQVRATYVGGVHVGP